MLPAIINANQIILFSFREPRLAWKRQPDRWTSDGYDGKTKSDWTSIVDDSRFGSSETAWYYRRDLVAGQLGNLAVSTDVSFPADF